MAGSRRKRSPEKDDPSKRRRTGEQAQSTNETTPQDPTTTSPDTTTNLEQTQTRSPTKQKTDDAVAGFMAKWEQMAPVRTQATSVPENSGDPKDSRLPQKTVRFVKGTGSASEVATNGDQDLIDDQLSRESGTPGTSELHGNGDGPYIEPTLTDEGTPGGGGGAPGGGGDETGGTTDPLPTTRLPQGDFKPHPILPRTDDEFEEVLILIKRTAWRWAFQHFNNVQTNEARRLDLYKLSQESPELMEYANWIALGGNRWEDIFNDKRASLVFGILGKMLEVHVFGHEMFGATSGQLEALLATEKEMAHVDGFARQQVRASTIRGLMANSIVPPNFDAQAQSITLSFYTMIRPLIPEPPAITTAPTSPLLDPTTHSPIIPTTLRTHINNFTTRPTATRSFSFNTITPRPSFPDEHTDLLTSLYQIISSAAKTSLNMRREPATIYHISSPPKTAPSPSKPVPSPPSPPPPTKCTA